MGSRLWFIGDGIEPIYVHPSKQRAIDKLEKFKQKDPEGADNYEIYSIEADDLEEYREEMDLAEQQGWV